MSFRLDEISLRLFKALPDIEINITLGEQIIGRFRLKDLSSFFSFRTISVFKVLAWCQRMPIQR